MSTLTKDEAAPAGDDAVVEPHRGGFAALKQNPLVHRLLWCLFGGFVLALVIGPQEGSQTDFGIAFNHATRAPRLLVFLGIGVLIFLVVTFWHHLAPYLRQPGAVTVAVGLVLVLAAMVLLHWYDPVGKFGPLSQRVSKTSGLPWTASLFFSGFGWGLLAICVVLGVAAVATRLPVLGYLQLVVSALAAVLVFVAHEQVVNFAGGIDHSLGVWFAALGYLVFALAGLVVARSHAEHAAPMATLNRAFGWRPGLPLAAAGIVLAVIAFTDAAWFAPQTNNWDFTTTHTKFEGTGLPQFASAYLAWLGPVALIVVALITVAACLLRKPLFGWLAAALAGLATLYTFAVVYKIAKVGADVAPNYGKRWVNLGAGGWVACLGFGLLFSAGLLAGAGTGRAKRTVPASTAAMHGATGSSAMRAVVPVAVCVALFYPPTLPANWQNVVVTQIAVYLLLAVGLNVVVGWAGLLDLGYIAFYGIGSYTTAYFTGSLPVKPPHWLHFSPLVAIPFAIVACLIAGVLLGAPTLRLRGDYLAIVTLGFGEIIEVLANNNPGGFTGGPIGPNVPHPRLNLGPLHVTWGLDNLPYWYLLLVILGIVIFLFYRLEDSRLGRAWAAIREDEVAAQATGVRTTRVKLLAFAIGASTSGVAGVFFASQVGYFDPSQFTLQNSILIVAYVVFGGMGSLAGALAGAAALTWLPYFLQSQVPLPDSQMWIGGLVIIMMIFRPAGLIPAKRRQAELGGLEGGDSAEVTAVPAGEGL
jgi:ABC-type branched-subunit amino acid transport system permease subunit